MGKNHFQEPSGKYQFKNISQCLNIIITTCAYTKRLEKSKMIPNEILLVDQVFFYNGSPLPSRYLPAQS